MKKFKDMINHPNHYADTKIEPIDVIEDWKLGFHDGNAIKYIKRQGKKEENIVCIKKAVWYLIRLLYVLTGDIRYKKMKV
jgi:hypothetical protein